MRLIKLDCKRLKVAVVGIDENGSSVSATNGNYGDGCTGEPGNCGCVHAEEELLKTMKKPRMVVLSHSPCYNCAVKLWEAGVQTVVYVIDYRRTEGKDFLEKNGVELINTTNSGLWGYLPTHYL